MYIYIIYIQNIYIYIYTEEIYIYKSVVSKIMDLYLYHTDILKFGNKILDGYFMTLLKVIYSKINLF